MAAFYGLSVLIPAGFALFAGWDRRRGKSGIAAMLLVALLPALLAAFLWAFVCKSWTRYECLLAEVLIAAVLALWAVPRAWGKKTDRIQLLKLMAVAAVVAGIYSTLTYGQVTIHSDTATSVLLAESQVRHHTWFPRTWVYGNGDIWVLDNHIFCFPFETLMQDTSLARMLGTAALALAVAAVLAWQSKTVFRNDAWVISIPLVLLFLPYGSRDEIYDQGSYAALFVCLLLSSALLFRMWQGPVRARHAIPLCILLVLLCMSGARYIAELTLPLLLTCLLPVYLQIREQDAPDWPRLRRPLLLMAVLLLLPTALGVGLYSWLKTWLIVPDNFVTSMTFAPSVLELLDNVRLVLIYVFCCFGYKGAVTLTTADGICNLLSIGMAVLFVFVIPVCQAWDLKKENDETKFFFWFVAAHNLTMAFEIVCLDLTYQQRYVITSVFLSVVLSSRYIYVNWIAKKKVRGWIWSSAFLAAALIECVGLVHLSSGWEAQLRRKEALPQALLDHGLTKGYATYWNAYNNEVFADRKVKFAGVSIGGDGIRPYPALVDMERFQPQDGRTFLLLDEGEKNVFLENHAGSFPEPVETFETNGMYVFVYDHDIVADMNDSPL